AGLLCPRNRARKGLSARANGLLAVWRRRPSAGSSRRHTLPAHRDHRRLGDKRAARSDHDHDEGPHVARSTDDRARADERLVLHPGPRLRQLITTWRHAPMPDQITTAVSDWVPATALVAVVVLAYVAIVGVVLLQAVW